MAERVDFPRGVVEGWKRGEAWDVDGSWTELEEGKEGETGIGHKIPVGRGASLHGSTGLVKDIDLRPTAGTAPQKSSKSSDQKTEQPTVGAGALDRFNADPVDLWREVSEKILKRLDPQIYSAWIKPLEVDGFAPVPNEDGSYALEVTVLSPNKFSADHIRSAYSDTIKEASVEVFGIQEIAVKIGVRKSSSVALRPATPKLPSAGTQESSPSVGIDLNRGSKIVRPKNGGSRFDQTQLNPNYNFSNFVVGGCNQFAHAVSLQVAENLGSRYNPLFIYGGVGLGKTHLVNAIGNASRRRGKNVLMVTSESFVNELIAALRANRMQQFKNRFRTLDLLIIDDVQFIIGKERTQEEFFHTFNELYQQNKQIILTSDKLPQDLVGLEERLRTRFASGISADIQAPDFETRVAIVMKKAEGMGFNISVDVAQFLSERIDTNVRELEGALNRLIAMGSIRGVEITRALAEDAFEDFRPLRKNDISTEFVQKVIAERYSVSVSDLLGKRRTQNIAFARQVAMYLSRKLTPCSFPEIGAFFGGRDHSTVIHAVKVIEERSQNDQGFKRDLDQLIRKITS